MRALLPGVAGEDRPLCELAGGLGEPRHGGPQQPLLRQAGVEHAARPHIIPNTLLHCTLQVSKLNLSWTWEAFIECISFCGLVIWWVETAHHEFFDKVAFLVNQVVLVLLRC